MPKLSDLRKYEGTLPYASEIFGVYSPLLGWKSARKNERAKRAFLDAKNRFLTALAAKYQPIVKVKFNADTVEPEQLSLAEIIKNKLVPQQDSYILSSIAVQLEGKDRLSMDDWKGLLSKDGLQRMLIDNNTDNAFKYYQELHKKNIEQIKQRHKREGQSDQDFATETETLTNNQVSDTLSSLRKESLVAGILADLAVNNMQQQLEQVFFESSFADINDEIQKLNTLLNEEYKDPFLTFNPKEDIKNVALSPIGIVHLYRQFFFELDTFLGSPEGHIWLSPKCTAELVETSSRKTTTEKIFESSFESINKSENTDNIQDDLNTAVNQDNKSNTKSGFSTTVTGSYPTISISATASLSMDNSQQEARNVTQKTMKQQTSKLSSEIRQNYKSSFKTITEVTDTSSKRYVLTNPSDDKLINYEMRRKMRQVGVQVQDMGTYLCWETFVDEPGANLGLANLVHLAKPADLVTVPDPDSIIQPPEEKQDTLIDKFTWVGGDREVFFNADERMVWGEPRKITFPDGYELSDSIKLWNASPILAVDAKGQGQEMWLFKYRFESKQTFRVGVYFVRDPNKKISRPDINLDSVNIGQFHDFSFAVPVTYQLSAAKKNELAAARTKLAADGKLATAENARLTEEAYIAAVKDRINKAGDIKKRPFDDLREEERTIVYRNLIQSLMTTANYNLPESDDNDKIRHVFSELINSVFDIDKMLYYVAPEWWKPRKHHHLAFEAKDGLSAVNKLATTKPLQQKTGALKKAIAGIFDPPNQVPNDLKDNIVTWSDGEYREDNYYITEDSAPARYGSSLGWLMQLDGDKMRNAFLNSPWVKTVIPIRPGKEQEAINWLQNAGVEGTDGLDADYGEKSEHAAIMQKLRAANLPVHNPPTLADAIKVLCMEVAEKNKASMTVGVFPKDPDIDDSMKVSATPVDKVYEHGFYPLQGGFRANPDPDDPDNPNPDINNKEKYFNIFAQWLEILPTDQIVPVQVEYDPYDGRMIRRGQ